MWDTSEGVKLATGHRREGSLFLERTRKRRQIYIFSYVQTLRRSDAGTYNISHKNELGSRLLLRSVGEIGVLLKMYVSYEEVDTTTAVPRCDFKFRATTPEQHVSRVTCTCPGATA